MKKLLILLLSLFFSNFLHADAFDKLKSLTKDLDKAIQENLNTQNDKSNVNQTKSSPLNQNGKYCWGNPEHNRCDETYFCFNAQTNELKNRNELTDEKNTQIRNGGGSMSEDQRKDKNLKIEYWTSEFGSRSLEEGWHCYTSQITRDHYYNEALDKIEKRKVADEESRKSNEQRRIREAKEEEQRKQEMNQEEEKRIAEFKNYFSIYESNDGKLQKAYEYNQIINACREAREGMAMVYINNEEIKEVNEKSKLIEKKLKPSLKKSTDALWQSAEERSRNYGFLANIFAKTIHPFKISNTSYDIKIDVLDYVKTGRHP